MFPARAEPQAAGAQLGETPQSVRAQIALREDEGRRTLSLPALLGDALVDKGLADVEDDDAQSHPATVSRSA